MKVIKFTVNTPLTHCNEVREAMGKAGAGKVGNYGFCSFSVKGSGRSVPLEGADPYLGSQGKLEIIEEEKIESFCEPEILDSVVKAIKEAHPYEEPAISVWEIEIV